MEITADLDTKTEHDNHYAALLENVRAAFERATTDATHLFTTDAEGLWALYLDNLPAERQVHTCHTCRRFVESYGGLVCIGESGATTPVMWDTSAAPEFYRPSIAAMRLAVARARVTGVFLTKTPTLGTPQTGPWTHLMAHVPASMLFRHRLLTPGQARAERREDFGTVARALAEFTPAGLDDALRILNGDALSRSEKFIGPVRWLRDLHARRADAKDSRVRDNLLWQAVASAPSGYCHPRASVIAPLLENIAAGMPFNTIKAKFDAMLHPLRYQRPQAAPRAGNIAQAEKVVEALGIARSLERRFARLDECETVWMPALPRTAPQSASGVFAHLAPKGAQGVARSIEMPAVTMTWDKFARTVMPGASAMELLVPHGPDKFIALTAAAHPDAPSILRWDRDERRNTVSWYCYHGGSPAQMWGLTPGTWCKITGIVPLPTLWGDHPAPYLDEGVVLVLDGAVDSTNTNAALFPEHMRDELRAVRSTIEAFSRRATLTGAEAASACGFDVRKGTGEINCTIRVHAAGGRTDYRIDRWD